jgi:MraZ protein
MKVLCGEFSVTLDEKNRLLVPAEVRRCFDTELNGNELFVVMGPNRHPWIYHENVYSELAKVERTELAPDPSQVAFDQMIYSMAARVEMDKAGRVLVPDHIRRRTKLDRELTMIGAGNHTELWNRSEWEQRIEELWSQSAEIVAMKKQNSSGISPIAGNSAREG